jgi:hypothetical protein
MLRRRASFLRLFLDFISNNHALRLDVRSITLGISSPSRRAASFPASSSNNQDRCDLRSEISRIRAVRRAVKAFRGPVTFALNARDKPTAGLTNN